MNDTVFPALLSQVLLTKAIPEGEAEAGATQPGFPPPSVLQSAAKLALLEIWISVCKHIRKVKLLMRQAAAPRRCVIEEVLFPFFQNQFILKERR